MARPIYPHELSDPDFQWLLNSYRESRGQVAVVDMSCLPLVMVLLETGDPIPVEDASYEPAIGHSADYPAHPAESDSGKK
jgi:hypothetical protein